MTSDIAAPARQTVAAPGILLRLEGIAIAAVALWVFGSLEASWWLFAGLILVPDVGLLGYLAGPTIGARTYNATHTLVAPLVLGVLGLFADETLLIAVTAIWVTHIGVDRLFGYGLKYSTSPRDTHLQRVR